MLDTNISHDISNSLTTIRSFAHLIKIDLLDEKTENLELYSDMILRSVTELTALMENVSDDL